MQATKTIQAILNKNSYNKKTPVGVVEMCYIVDQSTTPAYSLWLHELQQARLPCPLLSPGICANSCPLSPWCHPTISSSDLPYSSCPQSFPKVFSSSTGASASASVPPVSIQGWFPLGLTGLISVLSKGLSRVFSSAQHSLWSNSHLYMTTGKTLALTILTFAGKVMSLAF